MAVRRTVNFHLPLPSELYEQLREGAERSGQPATVVAHEALRVALRQRRKTRLHAEIAVFASQHAGSDIDLDEELERTASIESLRLED